MRHFFLIKHHPRGLAEVYQENRRQTRDLPDTRTIVHSLSNVKCRGVVWFFPLRRWRRTLYSTTPYHRASAAQRFHAAVSSSTPSRRSRHLPAVTHQLLPC